MIGTTLQNRYRLDAELGTGGMGTVYRAYDTLLQREVAVKVLNASGLGTEGHARLLREAQAVARLNHPNIISVYDAGESNSVPFLVMELVAGESLLDGSVRVVDGKVIGVLPPDQKEVSWESAFANVDSFELKAPSVADWSEQWTLVPSNFWHVDFEGVPPGLVPIPRPRP